MATKTRVRGAPGPAGYQGMKQPCVPRLCTVRSKLPVVCAATAAPVIFHAGRYGIFQQHYVLVLGTSYCSDQRANCFSLGNDGMYAATLLW